MSLEWRDYVLGLLDIGASVFVVDMLSQDWLHITVPPMVLETCRTICREHKCELELLEQALSGCSFINTQFVLERAMLRSPNHKLAHVCEVYTYFWNDYLEKVSKEEQTTVLQGAELSEAERLAQCSWFGDELNREFDRTSLVFSAYDFTMNGAAVEKISTGIQKQAHGALGHCNTVVNFVHDTTGLPSTYLKQLEYFDHIWVPASFQRNILREHSSIDTRVSIIPEAVSDLCWKPVSSPPNHSKFRFLLLSQYGISPDPEAERDWNMCRKASQLTLQAFVSEFSSYEPVEMCVKMLYENQRIAVNQCLNAWGLPSHRGDGVSIFQGFLSEHELIDLIREAQALVLVSRGEGWGRPLSEAMAMGVPIVSSRFGGCLDFANDETAFVVDGVIDPVARTIPNPEHFFEDSFTSPEHLEFGDWFTPSVESLRAQLRQVYADDSERSRRSKRAKKFALKHFDRRRVAQRLIRVLEVPP